MNSFTYRGASSADFGLKIERRAGSGAAAYEFTAEKIPGRDGNVLLPGGRMPNGSVSYTVFFSERRPYDLILKEAAIRSWLLGGLDSGAYFRLTDSYEPEIFRRAVFSSKLDFTEQLRRIGRTTITFTCSPYRYLLSGEREREIGSGDAIFSPYDCGALPLISVSGEGSGTVKLVNEAGTHTWTFSDLEEDVPLTMDSEEMSVTVTGAEAGTQVSGDGTFPILTHGSNVFTLTGGVTSLLVTPRWRVF